MGGNNTKHEPATDWNNHRTSEQSSALPYEAQIHTKYKNNINTLIENLHITSEMSDYNFDNFSKLLTNTPSYNIKYQNNQNYNDDNVVSTPAPISAPAPAPELYESPFLSPVKYANLLNSDRSGSIQRGGGSKKDKKDKKDKKGKIVKDKKGKIVKDKRVKKPMPENSTSSTDSDNNAQPSDESTPKNVKNKYAEDKDSDSSPDDSEENNVDKSDASDASDASEEPNKNNANDSNDSNDSEESNENDANDSEGNNNKYLSASSDPESVRTSQINMLDSY